MPNRFDPLLPELKEEGDALLKELRESVKSLDPAYTLIGFFNIENPDECVLFPTSDCAVIALTRDTHVAERETVQVSLLPIIESEDKSHIGGENWFSHTYRGKTVYSRKSDGVGGRNRPVGLLRDLLQTKLNRSTMTVDHFRDVQLLKCLKTMLDESGRLTHQKHIRAPRILLPVIGRLRLRHGSALENLVINCASKGLWTSNRIANAVRKNTSVTILSNDEVITKTPLMHGGGIVDGDVDPDAEIVNGHVVETMHNPADKARAVIFELFGVTVPVTFFPVAAVGETVDLAEQQTLFTPLPRRDLRRPYSLEELKSRPDYEALCYLAVLSSIERHKSMEYIDSAFVIGDGTAESIIHITDAEPVQRVMTTVREASGRKRFSPYTLSQHLDHVDIDLFNVPVRAENRRLRKERRELEERKVKEKEEAKNRRTPKNAMEEYHADKLKSEAGVPVQSEVLTALVDAAAGNISVRKPDGMLAAPKLGYRAKKRLAKQRRIAAEAAKKVNAAATLQPGFYGDLETPNVDASAPTPVAAPESSPGQVAAPAAVIDVTPIAVSAPVAPMPAMPEVTAPMPDISALPVLTSLEFDILSEMPVGRVDFTRYFLHTMVNRKISKEVLFKALTTLHNNGFIVVTKETITRPE